MFCFWTYLSLFFVLQHSVSADEGVSMKCSRTVEVTSGANVTLNCDIIWKKCENKSGKFIWYEANNNNLCDLEGNICKSDGQTYGSLTILNIQENKTITVVFSSHCGIDGSLIRVLVYDEERTQDPDQHTDVNNGKEEEEKNGSSSLLTAGLLAGVFAIIVIMVIFYVRFKIKQRISLHRRSQEYSLDYL